MRKPLLVAGLVALVVGLPAPASAAPPPCWQRLLNDYYDNGRIDHGYRVSCYTEAIRRIPRLAFATATRLSRLSSARCSRS